MSEPKVTSGNAVGYDFGTKFKLTQIIEGDKKEVEILSSPEDGVFWALFEAEDVDFELVIDNSAFDNDVRFGIKIREDSTEKAFVVRSSKKSTLKALETDGPHLHFVSQRTEDGMMLVAENASVKGITYEKSSVDCSRISFTFDVGKTAEEYEEEEKKLEMHSGFDFVKSDSSNLLFGSAPKTTSSFDSSLFFGGSAAPRMASSGGSSLVFGAQPAPKLASSGSSNLVFGVPPISKMASSDSSNLVFGVPPIPQMASSCSSNLVFGAPSIPKMLSSDSSSLAFGAPSAPKMASSDASGTVFGAPSAQNMASSGSSNLVFGAPSIPKMLSSDNSSLAFGAPAAPKMASSGANSLVFGAPPASGMTSSRASNFTFGGGPLFRAPPTSGKAESKAEPDSARSADPDTGNSAAKSDSAFTNIKTDSIGERGVVCFGEKTSQKFTRCYFTPSKKIKAKPFTIELRMKSNQ